jgi:PBP superfamily domain
VIPIAIGAITVMVNLPDGCDYSGTDQFRNRPKITNENLEKIFAGEITTWGAAIPGLAPQACIDAPVRRVVRLDSSGTTFSFKQLLHNIDPTQGWPGLANQDWPNAGTVVRGDANGNGPLRDKLIATEGGIGYADLANARAGGSQPFTWVDATDTTFWIPLQRRNTAEYDDPQEAVDGYQHAVSTGGTTPPRGANCANATVSGAPADSFGNWAPVDSTYSATGYNGCTLTYIMAFDDNSTVYCNSASEERKARTLKDFLSRSVISTVGQNSLETTDYDQMPADILAKAQAAVASIGWKKNGISGRPCSAPPITNPGGGGGGGGGGGTTTPPPPAVSNVFSIASARSTSSSVRINMEFPGAGTLVVTGSCKAAGLKAIKLARKTVTIDGAGTERVTMALNSKAKKALKRKKKLSVTLKLTYTPTGGTAKTVTRKVTVKAARR